LLRALLACCARMKAALSSYSISLVYRTTQRPVYRLRIARAPNRTSSGARRVGLWLVALPA